MGMIHVPSAGVAFTVKAESFVADPATHSWAYRMMVEHEGRIAHVRREISCESSRGWWWEPKAAEFVADLRQQAFKYICDHGPWAGIPKPKPPSVHKVWVDDMGYDS